MTDQEIIEKCARFMGWESHKGYWFLSCWNPLTDWAAAGQLLAEAGTRGLYPWLVCSDRWWSFRLGSGPCITSDKHNNPRRAIATVVSQYQAEQEARARREGKGEV